VAFDFDAAHQTVLDYFHARGMPWGGRGFGIHPAVLIIDMSYGWTDPAYPGGSLRMSESVDWIARLLVPARAAKVPIIYTAPPRPYPLWGDCPVSAELKAELAAANRHSRIDDRITPAPADKVLYKVGSSAFFNTDLFHYLSTNAIDTLLITGCVTSCCVRATVVDADNYGLKNILVRPCINDRSETEHEWHIRDLTRFGKLVEFEEAVGYILKLAR
jgi:maleamate amidohydrolase